MEVKVHLQDRTVATIQVEGFDANKIEADWDNHQKATLNIGGKIFSKHAVMYILTDNTLHSRLPEGAI